MNALEYGRCFTIDACRPGADLRCSTANLTAYLVELYRLIEERDPYREPVVVQERDGLSGAIAVAGSHLALHLFPQESSLTLHLLTRRDVQLTQLTDSLAEKFDVGRFESHLSNVARSFPREVQAIQSRLVGDRSYAQARLAAGALSGG